MTREISWHTRDIPALVGSCSESNTTSDLDNFKTVTKRTHVMGSNISHNNIWSRL
jgi:hypothetical protein